ncbi:MAG TPA: hypothetical protein VGP72_22350 [Planctomycetota bacterium]|jgi:hypothetical protein
MNKRLSPLSALVILAATFLAAGPLARSGEKAAEGSGEEEKDKPKEKEFKYSAWCAFRDLSTLLPPPTKIDPQTEESRPGSGKWAGFCRHGQWASLVLELKNTTEKSEFRGTASINLNPVHGNESEDPYVSYYRQEFEIGPQTTKQYHFSVLCPEGGISQFITIDISTGGRSYQRSVQLHELDVAREDFIVVVSESYGAFRHLATMPNSRGDVDDDSKQRRRRVAVVDPQELPTRWHDLTIANLLVIDGPPREKFSQAQWDAITAYVQAGGQVLITAGKDSSRMKGPLEELAGIRVKQITEVEGLDGSDEVPSLKLKPDVRLPIIEVDATNCQSVDRNKKTQLVERCQRYYGPGSVTFLPYSLSEPVLEHWEGRQTLPKRLIEQSRGRGLFSHATTEDDLQPNSLQSFNLRNRDEDAARAREMSQLRHDMDETFSKKTSVDPKKKSEVLSFLLFYLLFAVPGNYFIFGWFKRREIAWLAVPVWSASFSVLALTIGYMGQTGQLSVTEVSVIEAGSGQNAGMARTFLTLYAPVRDDYKMQFPSASGMPEIQAAPGHLLNLEQQRRGLSRPELYIVDTGTALNVEKLRVQQRSTRQLEVVHRTPLGGGIDARVQRETNGALTISVQNNTGLKLYAPVLVYQGGAYELGTEEGNALPSGEKNNIVTSDPIKKTIDAAFFGRNIVLQSARGGAARERAEILSRYVRAQVERYSLGTAAVLCAWVDEPDGCLPVLVAGSREEPRKPRMTAQTMLLAKVPIRAAGTFSAQAEQLLPVWNAEMYDLEKGVAGKLSKPEPTMLLPETNRSATRPVRPPRANAPEPVMAHFIVDLPQGYREMADVGRKLVIKLTMQAVLTKSVEDQTVPGDLAVEVRKIKENGQAEWSAVEIDPLSRLPHQKLVPLAPVTLSLREYRAIQDSKVHVRIVFTPNPAAPASTITITSIKCNVGP